MKACSQWRPSWLIDVEKGMLVLGDVAVNYATLSYVWADKSVEQLERTATGGIADSLKSPGGLTNRSKGAAPGTIKDAMDLCRQMRILYLRVAAICLSQDNITKEILNWMGKISRRLSHHRCRRPRFVGWAQGIGRDRPC